MFGARAGRAAAAFAQEQPGCDTQALEAKAKDEQTRIQQQFINKTGGTERIASLRTEMTKTLEAGAGIYRTQDSLQETCDKVSELKERFANITLDDRSLTFNTDLTAALELECMLDVAEAVAYSAVARKESRGSHQRIDHPQRDDENFLAHSMAYRTDDGPPRIEYRDVVITRWPPAERKYGD